MGEIDREETVPSKFARSLLAMVAERGFDPLRIVEAVGLDFNPLDERSTAYRERISLMTYGALYRHVLTVLQDQTFGMSTGRGVSSGAFRMLCYCILHCENLGRALRRASQFLQIFLTDTMDLQLQRENDLAVLVVRAAVRPEQHGQVGAGEIYSLSIWHRFFGWLIGRPIELTEVRFRGLKPTNTRKYENFFGCPLVFGQECDALVFPAHYLSCKLVHTESSLKEFLRTAPYQLMTLTPEFDEGRLLNQVRRMIGHDYSQGFPSFEQIAKSLNMSAPTLRRRLKREGTTYQQLKDELREEAAINYLTRPDLSINDVAALMGFTDPSAFHRSFKKWTGLPPGEFRTRELSGKV